jgi:hypothetical protein
VCWALFFFVPVKTVNRKSDNVNREIVNSRKAVI